MKTIAWPVALALSVILLSIASSDSVTQAQLRGRLFHWDTGVVSLGPNQVLRITGDWNGDGDSTVGFREIKYGQGSYRYGMPGRHDKHNDKRPPQVGRRRVISLELIATTYGRGIVTSNRRDMRVTASIINTTTGEITSHIIMANTEGDFH